MEELFNALGAFLKSDLAKDIGVQIVIFVLAYTAIVIIVVVLLMRFFVKIELTTVKNRKKEFQDLKNRVSTLETERSALEQENAALQETLDGLTQEIRRLKLRSDTKVSNDPALVQYVRQD